MAMELDTRAQKVYLQQSTNDGIVRFLREQKLSFSCRHRSIDGVDELDANLRVCVGGIAMFSFLYIQNMEKRFIFLQQSGYSR